MARGLAAEADGRPAEAAVHFQQALELAPETVAAHLGLGRALVALGRLDAARTACQRAIGLGSANAESFAQLAEILCMQGALTEATACLTHALNIVHDDPATLVRLGALHEIQARPNEAEACYRRALSAAESAAADEAVQVWKRRAGYRIGILLKRGGDPAAASAWLGRIIERDPDHAAARHMLAALHGETTRQAPAGYVRELFDTFAPVFDRLMIEGLGYAVPARLRELIEASLTSRRPMKRGIDLGCGTGLSGPVLRQRVTHLEGVDLSAASIRQAAAKGIYDRLITADITETLANGPACRYDLMLAADVLIYFGDLAPLMRAVSHAMVPAGWMFGSIESGRTRPYRLGPSGRFAHHPDHLRQTAAAAGLAVVTVRPTVLRMDGDRPVNGDLFVLQRAARPEEIP